MFVNEHDTLPKGDGFRVDAKHVVPVNLIKKVSRNKVVEDQPERLH